MSRTLPDRSYRNGAAPKITTILGALLCLVIGGILAATALSLGEVPADGLPPVADNLGAARVEQPVTAVLLNFRGYDTWLEIGVLVVVVLSVLALHRSDGLTIQPTEPSDPVLGPVARLLLPFMVLVAGYLLWAGTHAPGGAFQSGAVLGAGGILLRVSGTAPGLVRMMTGLPLRLLSLIGFLSFVALAAGTLVGGRRFLEYPPDAAGSLIFIIEAAVTISIGWTLAFLYMGATPRALPLDAQRKRSTPGNRAR
jgi:multisubunit Na+/H+ antiporter MnhB subunit